MNYVSYIGWIIICRIIDVEPPEAAPVPDLYHTQPEGYAA